MDRWNLPFASRIVHELRFAWPFGAFMTWPTRPATVLFDLGLAAMHFIIIVGGNLRVARLCKAGPALA